ncbi:condensation domain-containing protein [Wukongibacter sp. M2B1]|uniref:condensation domain-containing protein n=1 Tax=Wukongibacter sp. M2B1 TaxID=3088895 RepID=UPI003D7A1F7B
MSNCVKINYSPRSGEGTFSFPQTINHSLFSPNEWQMKRPFDCIGDFDNIINTELFEVSSLDSGLDVGENNNLTSIFDINVMIIEKKLNILVTYSTNKYKRDTVEKFINMYIKQIEEILSYCSEKESIEFTVSDFDAADISQEDLDSLFM